MSNLIDKMHKQKDTPHYPDNCGHPEGSYVGSIKHISRVEEEGLQWLDIYVYEDKADGTSVCIRYGKEGSQYISPGSILHVIRSSGNGRMDEYDLALHVIQKHGKITFIRN